MKIYIVRLLSNNGATELFLQATTMLFKKQIHAKECHDDLVKQMEDIAGETMGSSFVKYEELEVFDKQVYLRITVPSEE